MRLVALGVACLLGAVFLVAVGERVLYAGDVMPGVEVRGVEIAGTSESSAYADLSDLATRLEVEPVRGRAGAIELHAEPATVGLEVDEIATLRAARAAARSRNPLDQMLGSVLRRVRPDRVPLQLTFDEDAVDDIVDEWFRAAADGVVEGDLRFEGTEVVPVAPRSGRGIDPDETRARLLATFGAAERSTLELDVTDVDPRVDDAAVAEAAERARELLTGNHEIVADGASVVLRPEQLATALGTEVQGTELELTIDPPLLAESLGDELATITVPPVDARFAVDGTEVSVVPSERGRAPDFVGIAAAILRGERRIDAPLRDIVPERTTEWAEGLGIVELVSSFTTEYPSGQSRVTNIHRAADLIDGSIVEPGDTFSFNDTVGARTADRGFVAAPVFYGEFTEDIGGGVSQVATTLFNAVFFGGYEDVTHKPHSLYFSRYPMGREATVNYPDLDLKFRNDSSAGVLIEAYYTSSSITFAFYGDKEGKTVRAEGPNVLAERPPETEYVDWPLLPVGEEERIETGYTGYDVEVFRVIERPGAEPVRERFFWRYRTLPNRVLRGTAQPTTTTTPPSSTTAPPSPPTSGPPASGPPADPPAGG